MAMKAIEKISSTCKKDGDIKWNFTKFLVDKEGNVLSRYSPTFKTEDMEEKIKLLNNLKNIKVVIISLVKKMSRKIMKKEIKKAPGIFPMPVLMIGTYNEDGTPDVMNAAWGMAQSMNQLKLNLTESHKTVKNMKQEI